MDNLSPDQIKSMIALLQNMLPSNNSTEHEEAPQPKKSRNKKTKSRPSSNNKFENMPEARMHKEDILIDKKLSVQPPVPRARPFRLVNAICRVCGRKEKVNPVLITDSIDRYKCNKCSSSAG